MESEKLKSLVKQAYGDIAKKSLQELDTSTCCGTQCCDNTDFTRFNDDYTKLKGYNQNADLQLGCGIPTEVAGIQAGNTVLDLGSGAGNDAFVARILVGDTGKVIGLDMTEAMIEKAKKNAISMEYSNVEFILGDIENIPLEDNSIDVVISNCVLNLIPNKTKAFTEMFRVLKSGGHFSVSDIVLANELPIELQKAAEMYAGCVSGAIMKADYLNMINESGFKNIEIKIEKPINLPDEVLIKYLSHEVSTNFKKLGDVILSITVYGEK